MFGAQQSKALELIYDTAVRPGGWRRALDQTTSIVGARGIALVIRGRNAGAPNLTMMSQVYLDFSRKPSGWYYGAFLARLQETDWDTLRSFPVHKAIPDTDAGLSADELDVRADYRFLRKRTGVARRVGVRLNPDEVWFDAMSIGFDRSLNQAPTGLSEQIKPLLPHFSKAIEMGRMFTLLKARYRAALSALDHVQAGLVIALPGGAMIVENAEAQRIFDLSDGLAKGRDGYLSTQDADLTKRVRLAIEAAASTADGTGNQHEVLFAIPRPSGETPILLEVAPISDAGGELETGLRGALITLIDPNRAPYLKLERFAALYNLTAAETDVCRWVAEGAGIPEIADRRGTSPTTTKNQIAAVLSKTGVHSRAELIRLVLRVLPPVA